jgi:hypothetical protein
MSGLEVAGVVLGTLPRVISALEHYVNGLNTAKRFWLYKREMQSMMQLVKTERMLFENTIEQLLTGIVKVERMTEVRSGGNFWQDGDVELGLKNRSRDSYEIYHDNVRGMEASLQAIMKKLGLDPDGKVRPRPVFKLFVFPLAAQFPVYCASLIQFSPNLQIQVASRKSCRGYSSDYAEQLDALKNYNHALAQLTKQSLFLEPSRNATKSLYPDFKVLQSYARTIYDTLRSGLRCGCNDHAVKLRLENRSRRLDRNEDLLEVPFRAIFTNTHDIDATGATACNLWQCTEADIRYITKVPKQVPPPQAIRANPPLRPSKQVRFIRLQAQQTQSSLTLADQPISSTRNPTLEQIHDLCKAVAALQQPQRHMNIGFLTDDLERRFGIYPLEPPHGHDQQQWTSYSLRQVLTKRANVGRTLTQYDKLRVAVDLASSVLQLYKTPWLDEEWSDNDVFFVHRPGVPLSTLYEHPFVYRKISAPPSVQDTSAERTVGRVIRNQTLFTLGILLIELLYGTSIEELQSPRDVDCKNTPGVVWCTAERLVDEEIEFQGGPLYLDAVRRCIRCDFNRKESNLDDEAFQQAVFDGVVTPLEKTLQRFISLD